MVAGTWRVTPNEAVESAVEAAIKAGYRQACSIHPAKLEVDHTDRDMVAAQVTGSYSQNTLLAN